MRIGKQDAYKSRSHFMNKFYMYQGIHKTAMNDKLLNLKLHQAGDLVDYFMCDPDKWQVCFFDFSF